MDIDILLRGVEDVRTADPELDTDTDGSGAGCCVPLAAPQLSDEEAAATAAVFRALGDPHRVRIVNLIATSGGAVCVCDLTGPLGIAQPTVSHHLKKLVAAGLLTRQQRGRWAYYALDARAVVHLTHLVDLAHLVDPEGSAHDCC